MLRAEGQGRPPAGRTVGEQLGKQGKSSCISATWMAGLRLPVGSLNSRGAAVQQLSLPPLMQLPASWNSDGHLPHSETPGMLVSNGGGGRGSGHVASVSDVCNRSLPVTMYPRWS